MLSNQSLISACAGTPRYENWCHPRFPSWIPAFAGIQRGGSVGFEVTVQGGRSHFRTNELTE